MTADLHDRRDASSGTAIFSSCAVDWRFLLLVAATLAGTACAPLSKTPQRTKALSPGRLATDAVVVDLAFLQIPAADRTRYEAIWNAADEQPFAADQRIQWAANGLRVGLFGQQLPTQICDLLDARPTSIEELSESAASDFEAGGNLQHLPLRAGHRSIIKASKVHPNLALLLSEQGTVHGHQLADARCVFSLKAYPQGDGRVKLALTPEVEHGESKTRWAGSEGMLIQQTGQERLVLDRLRIDAMLQAGQSLVLSTTPEIKGLGEAFFSQRSAGGAVRRLLLIRFSQTQFDDLFEPGQTSAPLVTPGE
jgi:hypothetical protein